MLQCMEEGFTAGAEEKEIEEPKDSLSGIRNPARVLSVIPPSMAYFLYSLFHLLAPSDKLVVSHLLARKGKAGRTPAVARTGELWSLPGRHYCCRGTVHATGSGDRPAWLSPGLCCSWRCSTNAQIQIVSHEKKTNKKAQNISCPQRRERADLCKLPGWGTCKLLPSP